LIKIIRNRDVDYVIVAIPKSHKHIRVIIKLNDGTIMIFHEATIANIVRAYVTIKTHPIIKAVKLSKRCLEERKEGYAKYQLLEENLPEDSILSEVDRILSEVR